MTLEQLMRRNLERMGATQEHIEETFREFTQKFGPAPLQQALTDEEIKVIELMHVRIVLDVMTSKDPKARARELVRESEQCIRARNKEN